MKRIYLVRHATAVKRRENLSDFQRNLVKKGMKEAEDMAKILKEKGESIDLMISSPANRTLETAHIFARILDYPIQKIKIKEELYNSSDARSVLNVIRELDNATNSVMLFGHDPLFSEFAGIFIEEFNESIPKSGIVAARTLRRNWKNHVNEDGKLLYFDFPRRKAKAYKQMRNELRVEIEESLNNSLGQRDQESAKILEAQMQKAARRIAKDFIKTLKSQGKKVEKKSGDKTELIVKGQEKLN